MKKSSVLDLIVLLIVAGGAALMLYGWINYPTAPIREANGKFFDKQKKERTAEEFRAFKTWEATFFLYFVCAIPVGMVIVAVDKSLKKENK